VPIPEVLSTRGCGADSANQRMKNCFYQTEYQDNHEILKHDIYDLFFLKNLNPHAPRPARRRRPLVNTIDLQFCLNSSVVIPSLIGRPCPLLSLFFPSFVARCHRLRALAPVSPSDHPRNTPSKRCDLQPFPQPRPFNSLPMPLSEI
jgi:hypothetical protein